MDMRTGQRIWDLITGVLILGFGVALLVGNLDLWQIRGMLVRYWPVLLILGGVRTILLGYRNEGILVSGLFWLVTGILIYFSVQGWMAVPVRNLILPLVVIWFGVLLLYCPSRYPARRRNGDSA